MLYLFVLSSHLKDCLIFFFLNWITFYYSIQMSYSIQPYTPIPTPVL